MSVFEITILLLYLIAAAAFGVSRLPGYRRRSARLPPLAGALTVAGLTLHASFLYSAVLTDGGINLTIGNTVSLIGLELAAIALLAAIEPTLRGISVGLLVLGACAAAFAEPGVVPADATSLPWQLRAHVLVSLLSYGVLTGGAIVAVYALVQEHRLRSGALTASSNYLFAPLETTENLLFAIAAAGFAGLAIAILSGFTFVDDLFGQHLVHKSTFSILALLVFGLLLTGRQFAGWRGVRAVRLYLGGFLLLCLAYFGTRIILEEFLSRSWG